MCHDPEIKYDILCHPRIPCAIQKLNTIYGCRPKNPSVTQQLNTRFTLVHSRSVVDVKIAMEDVN